MILLRNDEAKLDAFLQEDEGDAGMLVKASPAKGLKTKDVKKTKSFMEKLKKKGGAALSAAKSAGAAVAERTSKLMRKLPFCGEKEFALKLMLDDNHLPVFDPEDATEFK